MSETQKFLINYEAYYIDGDDNEFWWLTKDDAASIKYPTAIAALQGAIDHASKLEQENDAALEVA